MVVISIKNVAIKKFVRNCSVQYLTELVIIKIKLSNFKYTVLTKLNLIRIFLTIEKQCLIL